MRTAARRRLTPPSVLALSITLVLSLSGVASGEPPDVVDARVGCVTVPTVKDASVCRFTVMIEHEDTGKDHHVRFFQIVGPDGVVLLTRFIRKPVRAKRRSSVARSVSIPREFDWVDLRSSDLVHGPGKTLRVEIPHAQEPAVGTAGDDDDEAISDE